MGALNIPDTTEFPGFTRKERENVAHLMRRAHFLKVRILDGELHRHLDLTWDKAELRALTWALEELSNMEAT